MTQYELPDGFDQRENYVHKTFEQFTPIKVCYPNGYITTIDNDQWTGFKDGNYPTSSWVGWAPIVPLKRKARFIVMEAEASPDFARRFFVFDTVLELAVTNRYLPSTEAAQRIADIYNEVII